LSSIGHTVNHPKQRSRGRGNSNLNSKPRHMGGGGGGGRNQIFDSNGPDGRIRGNAHQVMERYLALARDAASQDDRVTAENCYQHAEHYLRLLNAYNQSNPQRRPFPSAVASETDDQGEIIEGGEEAEGDGEGESGEEEEMGAEPAVEAV